MIGAAALALVLVFGVTVGPAILSGNGLLLPLGRFLAAALGVILVAAVLGALLRRRRHQPTQP